MSSQHRNPECSGAHCTADTGEVRLLPYGGGANMILCHSCFDYEMRWRRRMNRQRELEGNPPNNDIVEWGSLQVYKG